MGLKLLELTTNSERNWNAQSLKLYTIVNLFRPSIYAIQTDGLGIVITSINGSKTNERNPTQ